MCLNEIENKGRDRQERKREKNSSTKRERDREKREEKTPMHAHSRLTLHGSIMKPGSATIDRVLMRMHAPMLLSLFALFCAVLYYFTAMQYMQT
mmetsp:Transcript_38616/g.75842  ORF Transcript_38616/g.75842 Transcript_38616/m.75842 type:complete len:94 (-) Transcript_38616:298-579(-)